MNSLEEWPTFTAEQVQDAVNESGLLILNTVIAYLEKKRGYLDNPEGIKALFNLKNIEPPKPDHNAIKSILRSVK